MGRTKSKVILYDEEHGVPHSLSAQARGSAFSGWRPWLTGPSHARVGG